MPSLRDIKAALTGASGDRRFQYECNVCKAAFASADQTVSAVGCPHCGANDVRERPRETR